MEETRRQSIACLTSAGNMPAWQLKFFTTATVCKWLWKYSTIGLKLQINLSEWANSQIQNSQIRRIEFNFCSVLLYYIQQVIYPVCPFLLHLLIFYSTVKTPKPPLSPWGFSNNLSWGRIVSFFPLSHHSSMDICHSLVVVPQMMAILLKQLYPTHPVLLGSSSSPSLIALTATSCPHGLYAVWPCANLCLCHCHGAEDLFGFCSWGWCWLNLYCLALFFLPNILYHFACSAIIMLM